MRIILLGAPGVGKGTQSKLLCDQFNIPHVSTGDILRKHAAEKSELGLKAQEIMNRGQLVPDDLILDLVEDRLSEDDASAGFLLDGFPRTVPQAIGLDAILSRGNQSLNAIVALDLDQAVLINRLAARRSCPNCGTVYNLVINPPKVMDVCDKCGHNGLAHREDDAPETVKDRLDVYHQHTAPLLSYYAPTGLVHKIEGDGKVVDIFQTILAALSLNQ